MKPGQNDDKISIILGRLCGGEANTGCAFPGCGQALQTAGRRVKVGVRCSATKQCSGFMVPEPRLQQFAVATGTRGEVGLDPDGTTTTPHLITPGQLPSGGETTTAFLPQSPSFRITSRLKTQDSNVCNAVSHRLLLCAAV